MRQPATDEHNFVPPGGSIRHEKGEAASPVAVVSLLGRRAAGVRPQGGLDLHGPHDLRHTFATWLEDAGIPSRVIDELMGHESGRRTRDGCAIGPRYRHTTDVMLARVRAAIEARLMVALRIATDPEGPEVRRGTQVRWD